MSYCADVWECERSTRQVCWSELAGVAKVHESTEFNSNLKHTQSLNILHVRYDKSGRRVHRKPNVMWRLQHITANVQQLKIKLIKHDTEITIHFSWLPVGNAICILDTKIQITAGLYTANFIPGCSSRGNCLGSVIHSTTQSSHTAMPAVMPSGDAITGWT